MSQEGSMRRVTAIKNGTVIDHVPAGKALSVLKMLGIDAPASGVLGRPLGTRGGPWGLLGPPWGPTGPWALRRCGACAKRILHLSPVLAQHMVQCVALAARAARAASAARAPQWAIVPGYIYFALCANKCK